jgi:hypothetical protein
LLLIIIVIIIIIIIIIILANAPEENCRKREPCEHLKS